MERRVHTHNSFKRTHHTQYVGGPQTLVQTHQLGPHCVALNALFVHAFLSGASLSSKLHVVLWNCCDQRTNVPLGVNEVQLNLLTVVNVEVCQACPSEERASFHIHKAMFALLILDDLLYPRCSLIHEVPSPNAAIKSRVDLVDRYIQWAQHWLGAGPM